jgi:hypothetical protein
MTGRSGRSERNRSIIHGIMTYIIYAFTLYRSNVVCPLFPYPLLVLLCAVSVVFVSIVAVPVVVVAVVSVSVVAISIAVA